MRLRGCALSDQYFAIPFDDGGDYLKHGNIDKCIPNA
jgi:hypothetical protein